MIDQIVLDQIRTNVCAIGYLEVNPDLAFGNHKPGDRMAPPPLKVLGTGFLIRETTVLTNRHVFEALLRSKVSQNQWFLSFVYPREGGWQMSGRRILKGSYFSPHHGLDIAMLEFARDTSKEFEQCQPVSFGELATITVGRQVAICGYLYGTDLLEIEGLDLTRFGPIVHQGYISAVAPFDLTNPREIRSFLTDVSVGGGMSGSPVFLPQDGKVIGIHYAGVRRLGLVGFAMPVNAKRVSGWLAVHDRTLEKKAVPVFGTDTGDIISME